MINVSFEKNSIELHKQLVIQVPDHTLQGQPDFDLFYFHWKYRCNRLEILTPGKLKTIKALVETIVLMRSFTVNK